MDENNFSALNPDANLQGTSSSTTLAVPPQQNSIANQVSPTNTLSGGGTTVPTSPPPTVFGQGSFATHLNNLTTQANASGTSLPDHVNAVANENQYSDQAKQALWASKGFDPSQFDENAFNKTPSGTLYIKPGYTPSTSTTATLNTPDFSSLNPSAQVQSQPGTTQQSQSTTVPFAPGVTPQQAVTPDFSKAYSQPDSNTVIPSVDAAENPNILAGTKFDLQKARSLPGANDNLILQYLQNNGLDKYVDVNKALSMPGANATNLLNYLDNKTLNISGAKTDEDSPSILEQIGNGIKNFAGGVVSQIPATVAGISSGINNLVGSSMGENPELAKNANQTNYELGQKGVNGLENVTGTEPNALATRLGQTATEVGSFAIPSLDEGKYGQIVDTAEDLASKLGSKVGVTAEDAGNILRPNDLTKGEAQDLKANGELKTGLGLTGKGTEIIPNAQRLAIESDAAPYLVKGASTSDNIANIKNGIGDIDNQLKTGLVGGKFNISDFSDKLNSIEVPDTIKNDTTLSKNYDSLISKFENKASNIVGDDGVGKASDLLDLRRNMDATALKVDPNIFEKTNPLSTAFRDVRRAVNDFIGEQFPGDKFVQDLLSKQSNLFDAKDMLTGNTDINTLGKVLKSPITKATAGLVGGGGAGYEISKHL